MSGRFWKKNSILLMSILFFAWGNTLVQAEDIKVVRHATESWGRIY